MGYSTTYTEYTAPIKAYAKHDNYPEVSIFLQRERIGIAVGEGPDQVLSLVNLLAHQVNIYLSYESIASAKGHRILLNLFQEEGVCKRLIELDRIIIKSGSYLHHQPPIRGAVDSTDCNTALDEYNGALQDYPQQSASATKRLNTFTVRLQYYLCYLPPCCHMLDPSFAGTGPVRGTLQCTLHAIR